MKRRSGSTCENVTNENGSATPPKGWAKLGLLNWGWVVGGSMFRPYGPLIGRFKSVNAELLFATPHPRATPTKKTKSREGSKKQEKFQRGGKTYKTVRLLPGYGERIVGNRRSSRNLSKKKHLGEDMEGIEKSSHKIRPSNI